MLETVFARHSHGRLGAFDLKNGTEGRSVCPETDGNARTHVHARTHTCTHAHVMCLFSVRDSVSSSLVFRIKHTRSQALTFICEVPARKVRC